MKTWWTKEILLQAQWASNVLLPTSEELLINMTMAKPSLAYLFAAFLLLIVSISLSKPSPKSSLYDTFLHCFTQHTNSSTQFSNIVFPQSNPKFPFVTQNYIRNARFNTPSTQKLLLIVTPQVESHVQATVICAKSVNVQLKIRSGGHD
ncbi:hypothetical protein JHK85_042870 [Glycine max]|nr:hypothetical protein JHK85_042870 [Glycine max]